MMDPRTPRQFAGQEVTIPKPGDGVRVIRGPLKGKTHQVIAILGPAYSILKEVYLDVPGDVATWVWPWDVEVLHPR